MARLSGHLTVDRRAKAADTSASMAKTLRSPTAIMPICNSAETPWQFSTVHTDSSGHGETPPAQLSMGGKLFRVVRLLGKGGGGSAWLFKSDDDESTYAVVKCLGESAEKSLHLVHIMQQVERVLGGVRGQIKRLDIAPLESDERALCDTWHVAVLPYVDGVPLSSVLEVGKLSPSTALRLGIQVAGRIEELHDAGIAHRDIKPENTVLIVPRAERPIPREQVELIDFQLADAHVLGEHPQAGGTPLFLSPEQWEELLGNGPPAGPPSDVYAFGHMLYMLMQGRSPLPSTSSIVEARMHHDQCVAGQCEGLRDLLPDLRSLMVDIFQTADRRPNIHVVRERLRDVCRAKDIDPDLPLFRTSVAIPTSEPIPAPLVAQLLRQNA